MNDEQILTRYDKNLAHNPEDFKVYGESSELAMYLTIYLARQFQSSPDFHLTYIRLDMNHFSSLMGYDKATLLQKVDNPAHRQHWKPENEAYLMERVIEDALYRMVTQNIIFTRKGARKIGGQYQSISGIQLLKSVRVFIDNKNRNKIYYDIELSEVFRENLNVFYLMLSMDADMCKKLRKNNLTSLYLFLKNQQNRMQVETRKIQTYGLETPPDMIQKEFQFDELCELAEITCTAPNDKKKAFIRKMNYLIKQLKTNWVLQWVKKEGHSYAYTPVIIFLDLLDPINEDVLKLEKKQIFEQQYQRELYLIYEEDYLLTLPEDKQPLSFEDWKAHTRLNNEQKNGAYQKAKRQIWS